MQMTCKLDPSWINRQEIEALSSAQGLWGCIVNLTVPCGVVNGATPGMVCMS